MKIALLIVVLIHGLIHLFGFVKAFGLGEIKELPLRISQPMGILWLLAAILFFVFGALYFVNVKYLWLIGIIAVLLSLVIIVLFWKDAWFGTIPNVLILMVSLIGLGTFIVENEFVTKVRSDFNSNNTYPTDVLTESDIVHLPHVVQNYLRYTKSVGQEKIKNFKAEFVGILRTSQKDKGMKVASVQYNFYQEPSRYFYMSATKIGLPISALHIYQNEKSTFRVKLLNWINVVNASGEKMTMGETVTLFNDMCLIAPATLIDDRIEWEEMNDSTVRAHFTNGRTTIRAELFFNANHELVNFISYDRYETDGKVYNNYPWLTPVEDYKMMNGYLLPGKGRMIYQKPEGDYEYGELTYKSVRYNLPGME